MATFCGLISGMIGLAKKRARLFEKALPRFVATTAKEEIRVQRRQLLRAPRHTTTTTKQRKRWHHITIAVGSSSGRDRHVRRRKRRTIPMQPFRPRLQWNAATLEEGAAAATPREVHSCAHDPAMSQRMIPTWTTIRQKFEMAIRKIRRIVVVVVSTTVRTPAMILTTTTTTIMTMKRRFAFALGRGSFPTDPPWSPLVWISCRHRIATFTFAISCPRALVANCHSSSSSVSNSCMLNISFQPLSDRIIPTAIICRPVLRMKNTMTTTTHRIKTASYRQERLHPGRCSQLKKARGLGISLALMKYEWRERTTYIQVIYILRVVKL